MATSMFWREGLRIARGVSVPTPTVARFALTAIPRPELEPPVASTGLPSLNGAFVLGSMRGVVRVEAVAHLRQVGAWDLEELEAKLRAGPRAHAERDEIG